MAFRYSTGCFNSFLTVLKTDLTDGVIHFYTGAQPASPDDAVSGTLVATVTLAAGAWTAGSPTNGLEFAAPVGATIDKASAEEWKFIAVAAGTIGWGRFVSNSASDTGASSTTLKRLDFSVGTTSGDARMTKLTYAIGETGSCSTFQIPLTNIA
jgi:hypothetical protein